MEKRSIGKKIVRLCLILLFVITIMILVLGIACLIYIHKYVEKSVDETLFSVVGSDSASKIYYYEVSEETGELEARELSGEALYGEYRCIRVDYDQIPEDLIHAFVSIEDKRFYSHHGVDWKRTISAGLNYFLKFSGNYGGSTITQQLIKNVTDEDEYSFQRKIQEIFWALDLETKMDKSEIMGLYLNIINLSQGCYGVGAAADYYFSKEVSELTLNECACIAAITNNPSYYDPVRNPEHNRERRNLILSEMWKQGYISEEAYLTCSQSQIELNLKEDSSRGTVNSWYVDMVIEDVIGDLMEQRGYSRAVANLMIYTGGLQIYTAMDPEIQAILERYYADSSHFFSSTEGETPQSGMIVIDPNTGDILGVAGAIGEKQGNRLQNFATQTKRPAGSAVKPLSVYAPAMEEGMIHWASVYDDVPVKFESGAGNTHSQELTPWPKNSDGIYHGLTNVNDALARSVNTVTVRILQELGTEASFSFLYDQLHMKSLIKSGTDAAGNAITDCDLAALALGQMNYGVTVREITAAYSIFINRGIYNHPRSYYKVTDYAGSILLENPYQGEAVLSEDTACLMNLMLQNVVKEGTAKTVTLQDRIDCAGKTGTTQSNYDRWFIGYTPYYIGGVWYGYEYPKSLSGSNRCLSVWDEVMTEIHENTVNMERKNELLRFEVTENITTAEYCKDSGLPATNACDHDPRGDRREIGYFIRGQEPTGYCDRHVPVAYDRVEGGVCTSDACPDGNLEYIGLIAVKRIFPTQIYVSDAQYTWREIGEGRVPETAPSLPFYACLLKEGEYCGISKTDRQYNRACRRHVRIP